MRFVGYRQRLLDYDNFAGGAKPLLDSLVQAAIIPGDSLHDIVVRYEQVQVRYRREERTEIFLTLPDPTGSHPQ